MSNDKKIKRLRRAAKTRKTISAVRLCVFRTSRHIYAQVIHKTIDGKSKIIAQANTLDAKVKELCTYSGNIAAAEVVGREVALRALEQGVTKIAFDRSGFKYHGRVKALAESARQSGLIF